MNAGRELDVLVAEQVMGLKVERGNYFDGYYHRARSEATIGPGDEYSERWDLLMPILAYSTDIAAAWAVVEALQHRGRGLVVKAYPDGRGLTHRYTAHDPDSGAQAATPAAPHAICLAALKAVGVNL